MKKQNLIVSLILLFSASGLIAHAETTEELYKWAFDAITIEKGYTVSTPDDQFHVGVLPNVLRGETDVTIKVFDHSEYVHRELYRVGPSALEIESTSVVDEQETTGSKEIQTETRLVVDWALPEGKEIVSPVYEFDIKGAADLYDPEKPLWLRFHYLAETQSNLGVYFYDKGHKAWIPIPTQNDLKSKSLRAAIHLTYAPMAIFSDVIAQEGEASWYAYRDCNCAASRDYPSGTLLKVTDLTTQKSVIVEVNDYGPELWTGRIIDLDVTAFEQLTEKWRGLTHVKVEPYLISEEDFLNDGLPELF